MESENNLFLNISTDAVSRLKEILLNKSNDTFLRVEIVSGGCKGFNTKFSLDTKVNSDDKVFTKDNISFVSDITSLGIINGSTIEYSSNLMGKYFWLNIKTSKNKCSCGSSFSI